MTTPQSMLHSLYYEVKSLKKAFYKEVDDETFNIFDDIEDIRQDNKHIIAEMRKLNDMMALILKVLNKENGNG